jgi:2,3,4,5-tetrahydropyridine-2-carboxylate N-succinyltransferase
MQDKKINSVEEFNNFSKKFQEERTMPYAFGIGSCFKGENDGNIIATKWLAINIQKNMGAASALMDYIGYTDMQKEDCELVELSDDKVKGIIKDYFSPFADDEGRHENIEALIQSMGVGNHTVIIFYGSEDILTKNPIQNVGDAHFRLASMSRLIFKPNTLCLDNMFNVLPNLVYSRDGDVVEQTYWNENNWFEAYNPDVIVDKIPLLTWGAPIPDGVRIANPTNVRLGAYLSPGTTVMHYGFVNFNAGTLGAVMVEGRISAGTTIDGGSDLGAGAGFVGTLSGGGSLKLSAGKDCLIGANAECGVILGNNCVVATGVCFTQNTPFCEITPKGTEVWQKAKAFNGVDNITFRRHAKTGRLEVIHKGNKAILNEALHTGQ